jgi:sugar phosphate permease
VLKQLVNNVLKNPFIWGMALTYFFIYIVRQVGVERVRGRLGEGE